METLIAKLVGDYGVLGVAGFMAYIVWQMSNKITEITGNHLTHIQELGHQVLTELKLLREDINKLKK